MMRSVRLYSRAFMTVPNVAGWRFLVENKVLSARVFFQALLQGDCAVRWVGVAILGRDASVPSEHSSEEGAGIEQQQHMHNNQVHDTLYVILHKLDAQHDDVSVVPIYGKEDNHKYGEPAAQTEKIANRTEPPRVVRFPDIYIH